jgi:CRISPR/Cas system CSM-associated protein Csm3 (group 7 of RAMP superfamily)
VSGAEAGKPRGGNPVYRLTLTTASPLLIDGQYRTFTADKATARRTLERGSGASQGIEQPILPASALKGAMRIEFGRLMRTLERPICHGPDAERMCATEPCIVCRLFGGPGNRSGQLRFADALPPTGQYHELYIQRMGVGLSRRRPWNDPDQLFPPSHPPPAY